MPIRPLPPALLEHAEEELNEIPSEISSNIKILREWIREQPHLHSVNPPDQWLVAFLRGCKYDMEKAKGKIDMYYTYKATVPEFYGNRDPLDPGIQEILKLGSFLPLKQCMREDSPRPCLVKVGAFSKIRQPLSDLVKVSLMVVEILLLEDDNFTIAGEDLLVDATDLAFSLLWQWTPSLARKVLTCATKTLSIRLKNMHIMYAPYGLKAALAIFKTFLMSKMKNRIHSHGKDLETLYEHIDKSILPLEYGGTDGTVDELIDHWKSKVESYRDWFLQDNLCTDEAKRISEKSFNS